jgi:hypothetical protein
VPADGNRKRRVPVVDRLTPVSGRTVRIPFEVVNRGNERRVSVFASDGSKETEVVLDLASVAGRRYQGAWVVEPDTGLRLEVPGLVAPAPAPWGGSFPRTLSVGAALGPPGAAGERFETHFWVDGGADGVSFLAPGEGFHRLPSTGRVGGAIAEDAPEVWQVPGALGAAHRYPVKDPCTT